MSARLQKIKATNRFSVRGVLDCSFFFSRSHHTQLQRIATEWNRRRSLAALCRRAHGQPTVHRLSNYFLCLYYVLYSLCPLEIIVAFRLLSDYTCCDKIYTFFPVTYFHFYFHIKCFSLSQPSWLIHSSVHMMT